MKKALVLSIMLIVAASGMAQYQYHPFPTQTGDWVYGVYSENWVNIGMTRRSYALDTADGYMKSTYGWYYEQNKEIYFKYDTGSFKLVYDFKLTVGDTFYAPNYNSPTGPPWQPFTTVTNDDSASADWPGRRVLEFANGGQWVEGIGLVNDAWGIEYSVFEGSLSGGIKFECIASDSVSYPCNDAYVLSLNENNLPETRFYPNPINLEQSNHINIELSHTALQNSLATAIIYNLAGQEVLRQEVQFEGGKARVDLATLVGNMGAYVFELKTSTQVFVEKLMVNTN